MYISTLNIFQFRNLVNASLSLHPCVNIICGQNGSGKTSILEAIYFLSMGRSFRSSQLARIIAHEKDNFQLFVKFYDVHQSGDLMEKTLASMRDKHSKSVVKLNGEDAQSQAQLTRALPVQLFNPESFSLINSGAQQRSKLLDWGAFYHKPEFLTLWQQSKRLIKQRNAALKQGYPLNYIEILDQELIAKSESLDQARLEYFEILMPKVMEILKEFNSALAIDMSYYRGWSQDKNLADVLTSSYMSDSKTGITSHGVHRADLRFKVKGHPAQDILSRGQQKILISALKLAQGEIFSKEHQTGCIYLVDDLHSELDQIHLEKVLMKLMRINAQIIMTAIKLEHLQSLLNGVEFSHFQLADNACEKLKKS
ncbi:DNA replication/repair protein RecF [Cysteiniphilum halobium]|uniref:DNA replication/repair protein RecF n=1 Tax=Cysteiniphilum halobium TaxID=2219059 RepID=UPI000E64E5AD|nr:DNA replication/repair protein RecF [Cysteiniphilum halobium]